MRKRKKRSKQEVFIIRYIFKYKFVLFNPYVWFYRYLFIFTFHQFFSLIPDSSENVSCTVEFRNDTWTTFGQCVIPKARSSQKRYRCQWINKQVATVCFSCTEVLQRYQSTSFRPDKTTSRDACIRKIRKFQ